MYPTNNKPKLFIRPHAHNEMMTIVLLTAFIRLSVPFQPFSLAVARYLFNQTTNKLLGNSIQSI